MSFLTMVLACLLALYIGVGIPIAIGVLLGVRKVRKQNQLRKEFLNDLGC